MAKPPLYSTGAALYVPEGVGTAEEVAASKGLARPGLVSAEAVASSKLGSAVPTPGAALPGAEEKIVTVIDTDGRAFGLPESQLPQALAQGYTVETSEGKAVRNFLDENKGISGDLRVALKSFASEATFGVLGAIDAHTGDPLERAKNEALEKDHTVANIAGGLGGFAVSMLYGGELFGGASKAGKAVELGILGTKAGQKVAGEAVGAALARFAPAGAEAAARELGPSLARKMIASGAGSAVEGLVLGAPRAVTEAALGDPGQAAETLLYAGGIGALFGGVSALGGGVKDGIVAGIQGIATKAKGAAGETAAEGGSFVGSLAEKQAFRSLASNQASLGVALKNAERVGGAKAVGRELLEERLVRNVAEAPEAYVARIGARVEQVGSEIGGFYRKVDELGGKIDSESIVRRMHDDVLVPLRDKPFHDSIANEIEKEIGSFAGKSLATKDLSFEKLHEWRVALDGRLKWDSKTPSAATEELRKLRAVIQDELEKQGESAARAVGKEFVAPLKAANMKYARLSAALSGAEDYVSREAKNRVLSPTDYGTGIGGAALSALTGNPIPAVAGVASAIGHHVVRTEGNGVLARILDGLDKGGLVGIERAMKGAAQQLDTVPKVVGAMAQGTASSAARDMTPTAVLATLAATLSTPTETGRHGGDAFDLVSEALANIAGNPATLAERIGQATAPFAKEAPAIAAAYGERLASAVSYLKDQLPKAPEPTTPFSASTLRPSEHQVASFARKAQVVLDPFVVLQRLRAGTLTRDDVGALRAVYPALYAQIVSKLTEHARVVPYASQVQLSTLFGAPVNRGLKNVGAYQATFGAGGPGDTNAPMSPSRPVTSGGKLSMPSTATDLQRALAR